MKWRSDINKDAMSEYVIRYPEWEDGENPAEATRKMLDKEAQKPERDIHGFLADEMNTIKELYADLGLPDPESWVTYNDLGNWSYGTLAVTSPMRRAAATYFVEKFCPPLSKERYLARVADHIIHWRRDVATGGKGSMDPHIRLVEIGIILEMVRMRDNHLSEVTQAQAIARGRRRAAETVNREHREMRVARLEEMQRLVPKLGTNRAARNLEARGFGSYEGIKRQWSRFQKSGDT